MPNYYTNHLNAQKLHKVYQTRYPEVEAYFNAEISFVKQRLSDTDHVLELGAGYGRIMKELAPSCKSIVGIDISEANVAFGHDCLRDTPNARLIVMDAHNIEPDTIGVPFDIILCLQNGLSAMKIEPFSFVKGVMKLVSPGGRVFISSYSANFWEHRLAWFLEQAEKGLLGEIDLEQTKDGVIVGKDGFRAVTHSPEQLDEIGKAMGYEYEVLEVGGSSVFLVITKQ